MHAITHELGHLVVHPFLRDVHLGVQAKECYPTGVGMAWRAPTKVVLFWYRKYCIDHSLEEDTEARQAMLYMFSDEFRHVRKVLIVGGPGTGKTTLIAMAVYVFHHAIHVPYMEMLDREMADAGSALRQEAARIAELRKTALNRRREKAWGFFERMSRKEEVRPFVDNRLQEVFVADTRHHRDRSPETDAVVRAAEVISAPPPPHRCKCVGRRMRRTRCPCTCPKPGRPSRARASETRRRSCTGRSSRGRSRPPRRALTSLRAGEAACCCRSQPKATFYRRSGTGRRSASRKCSPRTVRYKTPQLGRSSPHAANTGGHQCSTWAPPCTGGSAHQSRSPTR